MKCASHSRRETANGNLKQKYVYDIHPYSEKVFNGTIVNRPLSSMHKL